VSTPFSSLSERSFCNSDRPLAEYSVLKGGSKDVVAPLLSEISQGTLCRVKMHCFLNFYTLTSFWDVVLGVREAKKVASDNDHVLVPREQRLSLFKFVTKHHWSFHLSRTAKFLNWRSAKCLLDEDFVRKQKKIGGACVHGTSMEDVPIDVCRVQTLLVDVLRLCVSFPFEVSCFMTLSLVLTLQLKSEWHWAAVLERKI